MRSCKPEPELDDVEKDYEYLLQYADTDEAYELSLGLREYRSYYKA